MSSDYEFSDEDAEYYDEDEDMEAQDDEDSAISDDEMDADAFKDDLIVDSSRGKRKVYEVDFESMSQDAVQALIKKDVDHISSIFGIDSGAASLLLRHMNWNKEKLIEKYMDNPTSLNIAAGVTVAPPPTPSPTVTSPIRSQASSSTARAKSPSVTTKRTTRRTAAEQAAKSKSPVIAPEPPKELGPFVCPICFDDTQTITLALPCGDQFCESCWKIFITSKIRDEGDHCIRCMATDCSLIAPDSFVQSTLSDDHATFERYEELIVRHFVSCNSNLKFCPYPSCTHTVSCPSAASKSSLATIVPTVYCGASATHRFCFGCPIDGDHRPVICSVAKLWLKKCQDDSETANWIKSNTKECSKCQSTIEKNGGCNHMTCKKCKYEFCWVCMGPWTEHGTAWYSCNRYDDKSGVEARDAQARSRASLERYLHYYNRWANHEQSAKLSVDLYAKTEKKMEEMQITSDLTWIEVQFAKKAVDEVEKCRMTLKWTYAMAYYLAKGNEKEMFEDNQRDLERAVEDLSELLESPIEPETIPTLRQKMTDKTVYVQKRNEILLEDTAKGYLDGRWAWDVTVDGL
ncbi:hypothetical protein BD410DRAFT_783951 [Rickenella mellea]|uniref:RBR-type E3 ubiquitin transferase n=1 Tax=Rickenella mellea TaxID=50990 RepID=A0A4Y7QGG1_9AGAM|nr:hypothetical protein BD410DRAFT_783951 [Rickenella mellea]